MVYICTLGRQITKYTVIYGVYMVYSIVGYSSLALFGVTFGLGTSIRGFCFSIYKLISAAVDLFD